MRELKARPPVGPAGPIRLTRYFAIASAVVMLAVGLMLVHVQRAEQDRQLAEFMAVSSQSLNHAFANGVWPQFADFIQSAGRMAPADVRAHPRTQALDVAVRRLAADTRVLKIKIYDLDGLTVYSTDPAQIGQDYSADPRFVLGMFDGFTGVLETRRTFGSIRGPVADREVYSSYVPVRSAGRGDRIEGMTQIYLDVTDLRDLARQGLWTGAAGIGLAFAAVFALLVFVVWRAERAILRHQQRALDLAAGVARAEAASRAKSEFLATMSHELRTPLNAVIGFADMIRQERMGPIGTPLYREYAEDIYRSGAHLLEVIDEVLDLARIEAGQMDLQFAPTDVAAAIGAVARTLARRAEQGGIGLKVSVSPDLPLVETDMRRLQQILRNLAGNAVKFTPSGGRVEIEARLDAAGRHVAIRVCDTGIGMREEDLPVALSPFGQLEGAMTRRYDGTGLGLPLSLRLAEALGATFEIESKPAVGTTVAVIVPVTRAAEAARRDELPAAA